MLKNDDGALTRRELLATLAKGGVAAPLALGAGAFDLQAPAAPSSPRVLGPTSVPSGKAVLKPEDLVFRGYVRLSLDAGDMWFSDGCMAMRKVGGQTRLFSLRNRTENSRVVEFIVPDTPQLSLASSPLAPLVKDWGPIMAGRTKTGGDDVVYAGGMHWDADRNALWWSYGDVYVPVQSHPTIGCTILNDSGGSSASFGPWRTQWNSQRTRGAFCQIPAGFASSYTSGRGVGIMAATSSGNGGSPWGANLSALELPDPATTPADLTTNTHWTIGNHGILLHDLEHRQARDTRYKHCGWKVAYDCRKGDVVEAGVPFFGGPDPASSSDDTMFCSAWIDLPDKHGLLYFGSLVTTPVGYTAPNDPDGYVHQWYGSAFHYSSPSGKASVCCHDQEDIFWGTTGPGAHRRVPMGWIYNPNDLVASAKGQADLWSRVPTSTFQWKSYVPTLKERYASGMFGGCVFDGSTRRLYVMMRFEDDITAAPNRRPVLLVFDVK